MPRSLTTVPGATATAEKVRPSARSPSFQARSPDAETILIS